MIEILNQNETHTLVFEKIGAEWWLKLIDRATGKVRIITFGQKIKGKAFFKKMTMPDIIRAYNTLKVAEKPMYKAGVM
jgi:hypothetical protein